VLHFNIILTISSPFDEQTCYLKFGSWTYDESKINLTALGQQAQLDSYSKNGEWDLMCKFFRTQKCDSK
jgi:hypothetical protein